MNLDRFAQGLKDPQEETPVAHCAECDGELYEGDQVVECEGQCFCDRECLASYLLETNLWEEKSIHAS